MAVAAIVWYGDPRHVSGASYNQGTAIKDGVRQFYGNTSHIDLIADNCKLFPRPQNESCNDIRRLIASYCDEGDPICASGRKLKVHASYKDTYDTDAAAFVEERVS